MRVRWLRLLALGDRKRLLNAISVFAASTSADSRAMEAGAAAERRQITVVFCDLAGSTELASRLDPEDLAATMASYHDCCKEVIDRWDGHVAEFLGDGAVIYFGWPRAHEDDAERAVRSSLELVASVGQLPIGAGSMLSCRAGVGTGPRVTPSLTVRASSGRRRTWQRERKRWPLPARS